MATLAFVALYGALGVPLLWHNRFAAEFALVTPALAVALAALSAIDLERYQLPDAITFPLLGSGLAVAALLGTMPLWFSAASAALAFVLFAALSRLYFHLRGRAGLGLGDAKLIAASGAWLGADVLPTVLLWATGAAIACILLAAARGNSITGATRIPFGPFLCFGTWLVWLYGGIQ